MRMAEDYPNAENNILLINDAQVDDISFACICIHVYLGS